MTTKVFDKTKPSSLTSLIQGRFGMDVEGYRRYKNLSGPGKNLRDPMSHLE